MKKLIATLILSSISLASAATVGFTSGTPATTLKTPSGSYVSTTTGYARVGIFTNFGAQNFATLLADPTPGILTTIATFFVPLGESASPANYGTAANNSIAVSTVSGAADGSTTLSGAVNDAVFATGTANTANSGGVTRGSQLFLIMYDSKNNPSAIGIYSALAGQGTGSAWLVPTSTFVSTANLTLSSVDTAAEVYRGSLGSLVLAPIPEPSTLGVLALGSLIAMKRRRR